MQGVPTSDDEVGRGFLEFMPHFAIPFSLIIVGSIIGLIINTWLIKHFTK